MFCHNCGQGIPDDSLVCPVCGATLTPQSEEESADTHGFAAAIRGHLTGPAFLAICILISARLFISVIQLNFFDIFAILFTCAAWITYANAKSSEVPMQITGLKFNSGLITAMWVINWVAVGLIGLLTVVFALIIPIITANSDEIIRQFEDYSIQYKLDVPGLAQGYTLTDLTELWDVSVGIIAAIFIGVLIISLIILVLVNIFFYGSLKRFAYQLHASFTSNRVRDLRFKTVSIWLLVFGILTGIGVLFNAANPGEVMKSNAAALSAVSNAAGAAIYIIAYVWVKQLSVIAARFDKNSALTQDESTTENM